MERASRQKTSREDEGDDDSGVSYLLRSDTDYKSRNSIVYSSVCKIDGICTRISYGAFTAKGLTKCFPLDALHLGVALKISCTSQMIFGDLTLLLTLLFPPRGLAAAAEASHGSDRGAGVRSSSVMGRMNTCKEGHEFRSTKTRKQHGTIQRSCSKFGSCYSNEKFHSRKNGGRLNELDFNTEMDVSCPPNTHYLSVREVVVRQAWV